MKASILPTTPALSLFSNAKKLALLCVFMITLSSCGKSNEEKADDLIHKYLLEELYNYESYSPIESKFEEAYDVALNDSSCRKIAMNIAKMKDDYQEGMRVFRSQMVEAGLFKQGVNMSVYSKGDLEHYPEILETHKMTEAIDAAIAFEVSKLQIGNIRDGENHIGYSVTHKFRYKDSSGNPATGNYYFLFDKQVKNILCAIDLENETNKSMLGILKKNCSSNE